MYRVCRQRGFLTSDKRTTTFTKIPTQKPKLYRYAVDTLLLLYKSLFDQVEETKQWTRKFQSCL